MSRLLKYTTLVLILIFTLAPCWSQQEVRGTILGRVTDQQDSVVPNAGVQVTHLDTGLTARVKTNEQGLYQVPFLPIGKYNITVEAAGFKKSVRDSIEVRVQDRLEINFSLEVGQVTETLTVTAEAPLLETANASTGQVVDMRRVADLPIAHGEPYALMATTTNAAFTGSAALDRPFEPSHIANYAMGGARGLRNELTLDGAPSGASTANPREVSASYVPPVDIVAEMKVQTTVFDATVGQTEGGLVAMSLKAGTNAFHGTAYYNKQAPELNANLFFTNRPPRADGSVAPRVDFDYNRWGTSATGPVLIPKLYNGKNRTFYMYGYEGIREKRPRGGVNTVPTEIQKTGDLSNLLRIGTNYQIYDPFSRRAAANGRFEISPIAGNIIEKSRISPIAQNILKIYASPNVAGTADGGNNLSQPDHPESIDYYTHTWRLDHNITEKWRTFGRFSWYNRVSNYNNWFDHISTGEWFAFHSVAGTWDHVYTLNPTTVMNLRYGYNRFIRDQNRNPAGVGFDLTSLGFPAYWNNLVSPDIRRFPHINLNGYYATNGTVSWRPQDTHSYVLTFDNIRGSHALKYGSEFRLYTKNQVNPDINSTGQLVFDTTYTRGPSDNSPAAPRGQGLAALLLGVLSNGGGIDRRATIAESNKMWAFYFQDDWRASRKLTLTLALRYEVETPLKDRFDRSVRGFDPGATLAITQAAQTAYAARTAALVPEVPANAFRVLGGLTFAGVNGEPSGVWNIDSNNLMPRIGLAYQLTPKTVIRAGYGLFYAYMGVRRGDVIQSGFTQTTAVNATQDSGLTFIANIANPFPQGVIEPRGAADGVNTFVGTGVSFFEPNIRTPYNQRWQFSIQRELPGRMVLETTYIGNKGTLLELNRDLNAIPLQYLSRLPERDNVTNNYNGANVPNPFQGLVPNFSGRNGANIGRSALWSAFPQFTSVTVNNNQGSSSYHSFGIDLDKRFSKGFTIQAGYTWSKFLEATAYLNGADPVPSNAISDQDIPHRLALSFIYELPFGKGQAFGASAPKGVNALISGWQIQGIQVAQVGSALGFGNMLFYGDPTKDIVLPESERTIDRWFNTSLFERLNTRGLVSNVRVAPLRWANVRGPSPINWDLSFLKNTRFGGDGRINVQIRGEFLNAFNHPVFANPNTDQYSTAFGTITSQQGYARRIQVGVKLIY